MSVLIYLIAVIIYMILGAGNIYFAIHRFKQKQYFIFGLWAMNAISAATYMVITIVEAVL